MKLLACVPGHAYLIACVSGNSVNRGGRADLPLFRTLLTIQQKSIKPSYCEVVTVKA